MPPPQDLQGLSSGALATFQQIARQHGYPDAEAYLDELERREKAVRDTLAAAREAPLYAVKSTDLGTMYEGNALSYMKTQASVSHDLIMTSPPFGLIRKKGYGNAAAEEHCDWFRPFAQEMHRMLTDPGDLVLAPFSGSLLTARVCEETGRRWGGTELERDYVQGGISRFLPNAPNLLRTEKTFFQLPAPCAFGDTDDIPLPADGGRKRAKRAFSPGDPEKPTPVTDQEVDHGL